jgi:hypothetical protein
MIRRVKALSCLWLVAMAAGGAAVAGTGRATVDAHVLTNGAHKALVTWTTHGGYAIAYRGTTDAGVVSGNTLTFWSGGRRLEIIHFHAGGLWRALGMRYGVTRAMIQRAAASPQSRKLPSPLVRSPTATAGQPPTVLTTVNDYGTDTAKLAKASPFAVRFAGSSILGKKLAHVFIASVNNPFQGGPHPAATVSGPIVTIVYSSDPAHLGVGDHQLTLTFASETSQAGQANATFLGGGRAKISANGLTAYKANENQIVFKSGHVIGVATATLQPTDSQWQAVLLALRSL